MASQFGDVSTTHASGCEQLAFKVWRIKARDGDLVPRTIVVFVYMFYSELLLLNLNRITAFHGLNLDVYMMKMPAKNLSMMYNKCLLVCTEMCDFLCIHSNDLSDGIPI